jgi:hypothetical protein
VLAQATLLVAGVVIAGVAIGGRVAVNAYKHFKAGTLTLPKGGTSSLDSPPPN